MGGVFQLPNLANGFLLILRRVLRQVNFFLLHECGQEIFTLLSLASCLRSFFTLQVVCCVDWQPALNNVCDCLTQLKALYPRCVAKLLKLLHFKMLPFHKEKVKRNLRLTFSKRHRRSSLFDRVKRQLKFG